MSYSETISYDSAASLSFNSNLVEVASSTLRLKDLGGGTYTTGGVLVTSQHQNTISSLTSFAQSATLPGSTAVQYQLVMNGLPYYYNATNASWALADGTYATTNTAAVINTNASTLFSALNLITPQFVSLNVWLYTSSSSARPVLTSNTIGYGWTNSNASQINQVSVNGYLADLIGGNPIPTPPAQVALCVTAPYAFFHGNHLVEPFTKHFYFDSTGYLNASIIETATPGVKLNFSLTFADGISTYSQRLFSAIVPNQAQVNVNNLSSVVPYNFG